MVSLTLKVPNRAQQVSCYECMCVLRVRPSDNVVVLHHTLNSINIELKCCLLAGCHSSMAGRLCIKQVVLGLIPGDGQTF